MATFRKRGSKWQVQVRRGDAPPTSKSFITRRDAELWALEIERAIERGQLVTQPPRGKAPTLAEFLQRYLDQITPTKRSAYVEGYRIKKIMRHPLAKRVAYSLTAGQISAYRDERLLEVSGETVRQDLVLLRQVIDVARREWGLQVINNPVDDVRKPKPSKPRQRRLEYVDLRRIVAAFRSTRNPVIAEVFRFALSTGMRRGEILRAVWSNVDWHRSVLTIPVTKNGHPRSIPLSRGSMRQLNRLRVEAAGDDRIFPTTENAVRLAWQRLKKRSGVKDFRFHDLRHEAVSRFFEVGLSLPEVALISGHKDPRQLMRYTHLDAANIAKKLL